MPPKEITSIDHEFLQGVLDQAWKNAKIAVNFSMVYAYFEIGRMIVEEDQIGETVFSQFKNLPTVSTGRKFYLSWSHYLKLMRINNIEERHFYEIESVKNDWSLRELQLTISISQ